MKKTFLVVQNNAILNDKQANFDKVEKLIAFNKNEVFDFIVLPEVWSVGWSPQLFRENAEELSHSETLDFIKKIAKSYNTNIIAGSFITKENDSCYNTTVVVSRSGELVAQYHKMHLFSHDDYGESDYVSKGGQGTLLEIEGVTVGLSICYDLRFPELFRAYAKEGAQVLVNMAAWPESRKNHWYSMQKSRAIENQAFVVAVSQCGLIKDDVYNLGHSMVINPLGEIIGNTTEQENSFCVTIDLDEFESLKNLKDIRKDIHPNYEISKVVV